MDEETMREGELSEAQLGAISGGCRQCGGDQAAITYDTDRRDTYRALARIAEHLELPDSTRRYLLAADFHADRLRAAQDRINARHPQGYEPARKRRRLR